MISFLFLDNKALVTFGTVSWPRFCIQKVYGNGIPTKKINQTVKGVKIM